jgi:hypothetical protein
MNGMSPVDNKFFELIIPIATFLTGTLSGIMLAGDDKDLRAKAIDAASKSAPPPSSTPPMAPRPFTPTAPTFSAPSAPAASPFAAAPVATGFGGKLAPPPAYEPEL